MKGRYPKRKSGGLPAGRVDSGLTRHGCTVTLKRRSDHDADSNHLRTDRKEIIDQLLNASRRVGELETKLLQLSVPAGGVAALEGDANAGDVAAGNGQVRNPV